MPAETSAPARVLVVLGTRPEAVKLSPVVRKMHEDRRLSPLVVFSGQHVDLLASVADELGLEPDFDLRKPLEDVSLTSSVARLLEALDPVLRDVRPDGVLVQGDTNTTFAAALVAFHHGVPVFHVEAGLRTGDPQRPFPEEMNRRLVAQLAALHFAPTPQARDHLLREGVVSSRVLVTGNTIVDALAAYGPTERKARDDERRVLVTLHRRENLDAAPGIARAIAEIVRAHPDVHVDVVLHLNAIRTIMQETLAGVPRVHLADPLSHRSFLDRLRAATLVLTDSGGVQEEAPAFGVPVLVLRELTERPEGVESGNTRIVGVTTGEIVTACSRLLEDTAEYEKMSHPAQPFGDGRASERIVTAIADYLATRSR